MAANRTRSNDIYSILFRRSVARERGARIRNHWIDADGLHNFSSRRARGGRHNRQTGRILDDLHRWQRWHLHAFAQHDPIRRAQFKRDAWPGSAAGSSLPTIRLSEMERLMLSTTSIPELSM